MAMQGTTGLGVVYSIVGCGEQLLYLSTNVCSSRICFLKNQENQQACSWYMLVWWRVSWIENVLWPRKDRVSILGHSCSEATGGLADVIYWAACESPGILCGSTQLQRKPPFSCGLGMGGLISSNFWMAMIHIDPQHVNKKDPRRWILEYTWVRLWLKWLDDKCSPWWQQGMASLSCWKARWIGWISEALLGFYHSMAALLDSPGLRGQSGQFQLSAYFSSTNINQQEPPLSGVDHGFLRLVWCGGLAQGNLAQCSLRLVRKYGTRYVAIYGSASGKNGGKWWSTAWFWSLCSWKSQTWGVDGPCMQMPNYGCHREAQRLVHFNSLSWWFSSQSISQFQFHFS